jgi:cytochrome c oxidase assembly factor CtaG
MPQELPDSILPEPVITELPEPVFNFVLFSILLGLNYLGIIYDVITASRASLSLYLLHYLVMKECDYGLFLIYGTYCF